MKKFLIISVALLLLVATMLSSCSQNTVENTVPSQTEEEPTAEEQAYTQAKNYLNEGKYQEAYNLFLTIKGYKDVDEQLERFFYQYGKIEYPSGQISLYEYDLKGNITKQTSIYDTSTYIESYDYQYDEKGYVLTKAFRSKWSDSSSYFEYDKQGFVTKMTVSDETWLLEYNSEKKITKLSMTWSNDRFESSFEWEYDSNGRIIKETEKNYTEGELDQVEISVYTYEIDNQGRIISCIRSFEVGDNYSTTHTTYSDTVVYEYNAQNNIIKETSTWWSYLGSTGSNITEYQYDSNGNIIQEKYTNEEGNISITTYSDYKLYYRWNPAFKTFEWIDERI